MFNKNSRINMGNIVFRQLPDINRYRDLTEEYDDYGRFGVLRNGRFYCTGILSSHDPATLVGGYWACSRIKNELYVSPRNTGFDAEFLGLVRSLIAGGQMNIIAARAGIRLNRAKPCS